MHFHIIEYIVYFRIICYSLFLSYSKGLQNYYYTNVRTANIQ